MVKNLSIQEFSGGRMRLITAQIVSCAVQTPITQGSAYTGWFSTLLLLLMVDVLSTCPRLVWLILNVSTYQKPHSTCFAIPNHPISKRISTWYLCSQTLTETNHECSTCQSQLTCLKWHVRVWHVPNTATLLACALERLIANCLSISFSSFLLNNGFIPKKSLKYNEWFADWPENAACAFHSYKSNPWVQDHYARGRMCQNPVFRFFGVSQQSKQQILPLNVFLCTSVSLNQEYIFKTSSRHTGSSQKSLNDAAVGLPVPNQAIYPKNA